MNSSVDTHFDAVIVGSGFGGSVMAYELSNAGLRVCLLERGKRYAPGSFPRSPRGMARNFWDPSEGLFGLLDVWSFRHSEAVVASGLGGGSLIYANVLLRKPEEWFVQRNSSGAMESWPVVRSELEEHYDAVEEKLGAAFYPMDRAPYNQASKALAFKKAALQLKSRGEPVEWLPLKLAVSFARSRDATPAPFEPIEGPVNLHKRPRQTCRLCGECDLGCNYGSKNTLDYNYLSLASQANPHPCEIRDLCEVKSFRPRHEGRGFIVEYVQHDPEAYDSKRSHSKPQTVTAERLILSAGTLGTTFLLLKNRQHFPHLSASLGSHYSTNGDLLTFVLRCDERITKTIDPSHGPVITSAIRSDLNREQGFYLQDAGYPEFVNWLLETANVRGWVPRKLRFLWRRLVHWITNDPKTEIDSQLSELLGPGRISASSMPLLGMGCDTPSGTMTLRQARNGRSFLQVDWQRKHSSEFFDAVNHFSEKVAKELGGSFVQNPLSRYFNRLITVHPLGGCPMGQNAQNGVVDRYGRVFGYPGLYIADGSVMPGPTGANPSLTIAALARRFALNIISEA